MRAQRDAATYVETVRTLTSSRDIVEVELEVTSGRLAAGVEVCELGGLVGEPRRGPDRRGSHDPSARRHAGRRVRQRDREARAFSSAARAMRLARRAREIDRAHGRGPRRPAHPRRRPLRTSDREARGQSDLRSADVHRGAARAHPSADRHQRQRGDRARVGSPRRRARGARRGMDRQHREQRLERRVEGDDHADRDHRRGDPAADLRRDAHARGRRRRR